VINATRHAVHATRVTVDVTAAHDQVHLRVRDDGEASATGPTAAGYGLVGMAERATLLGGTLRAGPDAAGGWTVDVVLPRVVSMHG
jgi:signal transduction histidine kinase